MSPRRIKYLVKSIPPVIQPMSGISTLSVREVTILPNAAPMITPTARSSTFPREMNVLNSVSMVIFGRSLHLSREFFARPVGAGKHGGGAWSLNARDAALHSRRRFTRRRHEREPYQMSRSLAARAARLAVVVLAAAGLAGCGVNTVPTSEENAKAKWADVESAYQRRADLVPNLVATAKAAASSETQILTNVTN